MSVGVWVWVCVEVCGWVGVWVVKCVGKGRVGRRRTEKREIGIKRWRITDCIIHMYCMFSVFLKPYPNMT